MTLADNSRQSVGSAQWGWKPLIFILISASFLFYGLSTMVDYAILAVFFAGMVFLAKYNCLEMLCAPLYFFDYVLIVPIIGGSFNRLYAAFYLLYYAMKRHGKISMTKKELILALVYFVMSVGYSFSVTSVISAVLNVFTLTFIFKSMDNKENRDAFLFSIAIAAVLSAVYAFTRGIKVEHEYGERLSGTISDPNFTALIYNLGIFAVLCCSKFNKWTRIACIAVMAVALIMTVSQTGIFGCVLLCMLLAFIIKPHKGLLLAMAGVVAIVVLLNTELPVTSIFHSIQQRLVESYNAILQKDYGAVTTNRSNLWVEYLMVFFGNISVIRMFVGGINPTTSAFRQTWNLQYASHNSFVDALFMAGILGFLIVVVYLAMGIYKNIVLYKKSGDKTYLGFAFIKIVTVMFAFVLSYFTSKLFSIGFLL